MGTALAFPGTNSYTSIQRYNLIANPKVALDLNNWFSSVSTSPSSLVRNVGTGPIGYTTYARASVGAATATYVGCRIVVSNIVSIKAGTQLTFSAYLRPSTAVAATSAMYIQWLDASGAVLQTDSNVGVSAITQAVFTRASVTGTAPANVASLAVFGRASALSGNFVTNDFCDVSAAQLEYGASATTYLDGDLTNSPPDLYSWQNAANASVSLHTQTITAGNAAVVGDEISGSWTIEEAVSPVDILDTSGSTGGVSATFRNITQGTGTTPTSPPVPSSDYTQGQPYTFSHDLGTINGSILTTSPQSSTIGMTGSTPLSPLTVNMSMPAFTEGQVFYSWKRKLPSGVVFGAITDMAVDANGNIWITGGATGSNASMLFDRFGNYIMGLTHSFNGHGIEIDSVGNIYVMGNTAGVQKFDSTGASLGVIITVAAGTFQMMSIDGADSLWIATTETGANNAIKHYSSTGTFLGKNQTYDPTAVAPGPNTYVTYTDMSWANNTGNEIWIGNQATDVNRQETFEYKRVNSSTGATIAVVPIGTAGSEYTGLGMDWTPNLAAFPTNSVRFFSQTGLSDNRGKYLNTDITTTSGKESVLATDHLGGSYWIAVDDTVYRVAGGQMGGNQALECYLGAAGYTGKVTYTAATPYNETIGDLNITYPVCFPAWDGDVWSNLKALASRLRRNITTDGSGILISRNNTRVDEYKIDLSNREAPPQIAQDQPGAQEIVATCQNAVAGNGTGGLGYYGTLYQPLSTDTPLAVDSVGTSVVTIQANVYATHFDPMVPTDVTWSDPLNSVASKYPIVDSSTPPLRVPAATWTKAGGSVTATPSIDTPGAIDFTIVGPGSITGFTSPYRLGDISGNTVYSAFKVVGYGFTVNPKTFSVMTGAPRGVGSELVSQTLDSPFLNDMSNTYDVIRMSAAKQAGGKMTCSVSVPVTSIKVGFGRIAGSYFYWKRNYWRVTGVTVSGGWVDLNAEVDTRISDVQDGTVTHNTIDATWAGYRYQDNYISPGVL